MKSSVAADSDIPKLQAPGAGLPLPQRLAIRLWYGPVVSRRASFADSRLSYESLVGKIIGVVSAIPPELRSIKVLVAPMIGLEDSSRFWSAHGVLEHLLIVGHAMEAVILSLGAGRIPPGVADTAKVKPAQAEGDWLAEFSAYAPSLAAKLDEKLAAPGMDADSAVEFRHPWFGPMTLRQWYWLLANHQGVHYQQLKGIREGLARGGASV
jgi:hypothetical protein